jgi:hypothetical protein
LQQVGPDKVFGCVLDIALKHRRSSLRLSSNYWLILIAAALVFGVTYAAICAGETRVREERLAALDSQVRFAVIAVDTRIEIELQQLRDLAQSETLKRRQFDEFYKEARRFAERNRRQVVLHDITKNAQILNTAYPAGARMQEGVRFLQKTELDRLRADRPYISNLFSASLAQKSLIAAAVPISEDGNIRYLLGVAIDPSEILAAVRDITLAKGTVTLIVDRNGVILARSAEHEKYMGRKAPRNMTARAEKSGRLKGATFDGTLIDLSYLQSELTGWAAVSLTRDRTDSQWPLIAALFAALCVVVCGSIWTIAANAMRRRLREDDPQA